jgi:hypothetical protein
LSLLEHDGRLLGQNTLVDRFVSSAVSLNRLAEALEIYYIDGSDSKLQINALAIKHKQLTDGEELINQGFLDNLVEVLTLECVVCANYGVNSLHYLHPIICLPNPFFPSASSRLQALQQARKRLSF